MSDELERLALAVNELTKPRQTVSQVGYWDRSRHRKLRTHTVTHAPLLVELANVGGGGSQSGDERGARYPTSRPPLRLDALDAQRAILAGVLTWLERLAAESRGGLYADLGQLVGLALPLPDSLAERVAHAAQGWATLAKVVTGFESAAFRPRAACPLCSEMQTLRVRVETASAACVACGEGWRKSDGTIYMLAEHIRQVNGERETESA